MWTEVTELWIWQRIVSPHIAGLANALGKHLRVVYVSESIITDARQAQGWEAPTMENAELRRVRTTREARALVEVATERSIHLCQGIRANGLIGIVQRCLARRNLEQWIVMEKVKDAGFMGAMRRAEYWRCVRQMRESVKGILAIGDGTLEWLVQRGWNEQQVYPFAYFLRSPEEGMLETRERGRYRIVFCRSSHTAQETGFADRSASKASRSRCGVDGCWRGALGSAPSTAGSGCTWCAGVVGRSCSDEGSTTPNGPGRLSSASELA